jgi:hypothetical protein
MLSLQYLAGFTDADGSITISKFKTTTGCGLKFRIRVRIANIRLDILEQIKKQYGGWIEKIPRKANDRQCYRWCTADKSAAKFLQKIYPYLFIKKKQASMCLELYEMSKKLKTQRKNTGQFIKASKKELQRKLQLVEEIRLLNRRGFLGA